jgi:hypothetical protein
MKTKIIVTVLFVLPIFVACTPIATVTPPANSFSLIFQYTPCGPTPMYVLDTSSGQLVYTPLGDTTSTTISLLLTDDELETIYQKALSIGFFDYPSKFVVPNDQALGDVTPATSYEISMSDGTLTNSVSWIDEAMTKPGYTKADQLRELMKLIYKTIQSHPKVQQFPKPKIMMLCA